MGAALHQAQQARLRKGALTARGAGVAEKLGIGHLVGHVHATAVQRHHAQSPVPRPWRLGRCQRTQHALGQLVHDLGAQTGTRLRDRRLAGLHRSRLAAAEPLQAFADHPQHFFQRRLAPQRQRHHVVHHRRCRQQSLTLAGLASVGQHLRDQRAGTHAGQHSCADQMRNVSPRRKRLAGSCHRPCPSKSLQTRIINEFPLSEQYLG